MADPTAPVPSLARARELKIQELSSFFANDDLSLDDLERRIERVYKAASVAELETITADLRSAVAMPAEFARAKAAPGAGRGVAAYEVPNSRMFMLMSSARKAIRSILPRRLDVLSIMSDSRIDLTQATLSPGISEIGLRAIMASVRVIVPPGTRVLFDVSPVMADVGSRADEPEPNALVSGNTPVVRLTGFAFMAEVKVVVRRREEPLADGE